jgi:hypothetical protein
MQGKQLSSRPIWGVFAQRRNIIVLLVSLVWIVSLGQSVQAQSSACPSGAIQLRPGDNLQQIVDRNPAGSIYCFTNGTYNRASIIPKDGDSYIAASTGNAILDGNGAMQHAISGTRSPGDPANSENVVVSGFVIQGYRTNLPYQVGAVDANVGWRVQNNIFRDNDTALVYGRMNWACSQGAIVENNRFENNRFVAFYYNGTRANIAGNTFVSNGWQARQQDSDWYGSIKVTNQGMFNSSFSRMTPCPTPGGENRIIVTLNTSAFNRAAGWWNDINVSNIEITYNHIVGNEWFGIFHEISGSALIAHNVVECNRLNRDWDGFWGGGDVAVFSSSNAVVRDNNVTVCSAGAQVTAAGQTQTARDSGRGIILLSEGRAPLNNNQVIGNTISVRGGGIEYFVGITSYNGSPHSGNVFDRNNYVGGTASQNLWNWFDNLRNFASWQSQGVDSSSQVGGSTPATPTRLPPTATVVMPSATPRLPTATPVVTSTRIPPTPTVVAQLPTATPVTGSQPYFGAPLPVPGRIQAEDFNLGANNVAYFDTTTTQDGGTHYRRDANAVDLKPNPDGNFTVGWFINGEWLDYTINVAQTGDYDITLRTGAVDAGRQLSISINGQTIAQNITVPQITNWDNTPLPTLTLRGIALTAGTQVMRITNVAGYLDLDWVEFTLAVAASTTPLPTVVAPTNTPAPIAPTATPAPTTPSLRAVANAATYLPGSAISVDFILDLPNLQPGGGVRALEAACAVAPTGIVTGQTITAGALFGPSPVTVNAGFRPDGTFTYATSQSGANPSITTQGSVFTANLMALAEGTAQVSCNITVINGDGSETSLSYTPANLVVANTPTATFIPPTTVPPTGVPPTATFIPTETAVPPTATLVPTVTMIPPTATVIPSATPVIPTATPLPTNTPAPTLGSVSGNVQRSATTDASGITINLIANGAVVGTTTTSADGSFTLSNVAAGNYVIRAEALGYLPAEGTVTIVAGQTAQKTAITLMAGDVMPSNPPVIDELDVVLMATSYGTAETSTQLAEDVDGNGRVGLGDLTALAENLRATGPQRWN